MISTYLSRSGLTLPEDLVAEKLSQLESFLSQAQPVELRWQYEIPELGEGGACSLFGQLQQEPFLLTDYFSENEQNTALLEDLQRIINYVVAQTRLDWFGIYRSTETQQGLQLLKLAYAGAPSRPLFPLTEAFAATSNNVQVALTQHAKVINNVATYLASGGEYYTCDPKVKSESCLPLIDKDNQTLGIIDAEAFDNDFFDQQNLALLVACCIKIPQLIASHK